MKAKPFVLVIIKGKGNPGGILLSVGLQNGLDAYVWTALDTEKGATITFDKDVYFKGGCKTLHKNYEGNDFAYRNGKVYINGQQTIRILLQWIIIL